MGSNASKSPNDETKTDECESPNNPDPRSPTSDIVRTPLQNKNEAKHNITKNVDLRQTFENGDNKIYHCNPILSAVIKNHLQSYDPRSPTQDFDRTPIIIASKIKELAKEQNLQLNDSDFESPLLENEDLNDNCNGAKELNNDNLIPKNLCEGFFDMTLDDTFKSMDEPLGTGGLNETIECSVTKETCPDEKKLLETNFDYVQNDEFEKCANKHFDKIKNCDADPRSPSTNIERSPIFVKDIEENVEDMSDETLIKVLQNKNADLRHTMTMTKIQEKNPEGLLIYEDELTPDTPACTDTPKKSKSDGSGSRTPLSCMKNKDDAGYIRSKSANTLYDPKCQNSKINKKVSHIPRLKSLSRQTRTMQMGSSVSLKNISKPPVVLGDCENTPPHSHRDRWDKDNSIVL